MWANLISTRYIFSFVVLFLVLTSAWIIDYVWGSPAVILLLLQLAIVVIALQCSIKLAYFSAIIEALSFNFLFTTPRYSLQMFNINDIMNLLVFIFVAFATSKLAQHYRRQQHELKQAQLRNSILLSVSHDLRTPLATIIGTLTTLKEYMAKLSEFEKQELLDSATAESHRLHQYIENLLQATRMQHGTLTFKKLPVSIVSVIDRVVERFSDGSNRIALNTEKVSQLYISSSLIEQAIFNVVDNALRYSPKNKPVCISLYCAQDYVHIDVQDYGQGIDPKYADNIFELFYSSHDHQPSDSGSGSGIGLAVSKGIIAAHQGHISFIPVEQGCLIRIALPISKREA
ncbi:sensor histidine kinase [Shewanella vesiculosa]|uniref:sensor histidine kinase n=1 Tax=Shewanella vesiculosa TaxID=518738 RepID=UPI003D0271F1